MVELTLTLDTAETEFSFLIDKPAAERINRLVKLENMDNHGLRIKVVPGGCVGFIYEYSWLSLDKIIDETIIETDGASVIFSPSDLRHVSGSTLQYSESLASSKFELKNPNASSVCGCGKSFA